VKKHLVTLLPLIAAATTHAVASHDLATTRVFHATLAASNMTVLTHSPGRGEAHFILDLPTLTLTYTVQFDDLTSAPTSVFIHGPAHPGTNAPRMLDLAPNGINGSPLEGDAKVTESHVQYMLQGWAYVVIGTANNPEGEIRGKFNVVPPN